MLSKKILLLFSVVIGYASSALAQQTDTLFKPANILKTMERVADWQLNTWKEKGQRWPKYDWTNAAGYTGILELGKLSKDDKYINYLVSIGNDLNWNTGPRRFMADDYCVGQTYANMV